MSRCTVRLADGKGDVENEVWDDFIIQNAAYPFYTMDWLRLMERYTGLGFAPYAKATLLPIMTFKYETPTAVFPAYLFRAGPVKLALSPPPHVECHYLGPVVSGKDRPEKLLFETVSTVHRYLLKAGVRWMLVKTNPSILDSRPFKWSGYAAEPMHTYLINLTRPERELWECLSKTARREINNSQKHGVVIREGNKSDIQNIYSGLSSRKRIGAAPEFLKDVFDNLREYVQILVMEDGSGNYITGTIVLHFNNCSCYWIGGVRPQYRRHSVTPLIWESILLAKERGSEAYDLMGANDPALSSFKSKFGGTLQTYLRAEHVSCFLKLLRLFKGPPKI